MELLRLFVCISACFVNQAERFPALVFGAVDCLFYFVGAEIDGAKGYIMTGFFDAITACILYAVFLHTRDKLSVILLAASALSILINIYGLAAYESYSEPFIYNSLFAIYYLTIIVLFFFTD